MTTGRINQVATLWPATTTLAHTWYTRGERQDQARAPPPGKKSQGLYCKISEPKPGKGKQHTYPKTEQAAIKPLPHGKSSANPSSIIPR